jgi:hypothetical protein
VAEEPETTHVAALTRRYVAALPPTVTWQTANRVLSIGRSTGYGLAKRGEYPCKVLKLGNGYRVVTVDLQRLLALDEAVEELALAKPQVHGGTHIREEVTRGC